VQIELHVGQCLSLFTVIHSVKQMSLECGFKHSQWRGFRELFQEESFRRQVPSDENYVIPGERFILVGPL